MVKELSGGALCVDALRQFGADRVFCVPGESYLTVLDALYETPEIELVTCRQEGGAAMMAAADGRLTGRPGICMVTRGPGASNASSGLHVAMQDGVPMVLFVGQVARTAFGRGAFQEIDYRQMFGPVAKWVAQIERADRVQEHVARAFATATAGRPGPVVLALPEDMLDEVAAAVTFDPATGVEQYPSDRQMTTISNYLGQAERPLVVLGGTGWDQETCDKFRLFVERSGLPVATSFRRQDLFDNDHPNYVGDMGVGVNPQLKALVNEADVLLVVGSRLGEITSSGYTLFDVPKPRQTLLHIMAGPEEIGAVYQPKLGVIASPQGFAARLEALDIEPRPEWQDWVARGRAEYLSWQTPVQLDTRMDMGIVHCWLRDTLPADAVMTNGAGNFAAWIHRYHRFRQYGSQVASTSGSMGFGYPAAVAAKLRFPERPVICIAGDGDFLMTGQELATACQYGIAVITVIVDNGMYGTIRMHQEREFPSRVKGTDLSNPDFVGYARAFGAHAEFVDQTAEFAPAFERAAAHDGPSVIHVRVDPEVIAPGQTVTRLRALAEAAS